MEADHQNLDHAKDFDQQYRIPFEQQEKWKNYLQENGFVVVTGFLSENICQEYVDQFWEMMRKLSQGKVRKDNDQSQRNLKNYPPLLHGGMIQYIGHSRLQWELRLRCKRIFEKIWNNDDLKCSFDGFCFMNGKLKYEPREQNAFLHTDQSPMRNKLWSYQGIMTLTDAGENGGGFVCVPGSHKYHQQFFQNINRTKQKKDWFLIPEQEKYKEPLCNTLKVNSKAGDFILFDSRTFHCNTVPTTENLRVCTYICMIPAKKVPPQTLELRKMAQKNKATTSHHPGDGFRCFPALPREVDDPEVLKSIIDQINEYDISEDMNKMV